MKINNPESPEAREARVVALLAKELSPKEAAEVRRLMESDPALMAFYNRMSRTVEMVRASVEPTASQALRLSESRRGVLLAHLKKPAASVVSRPRRDWSWVGPLALAACVIFVLGGLMLPVLTKSKRMERLVAWRHAEDAGFDRSDGVQIAGKQLNNRWYFNGQNSGAGPDTPNQQFFEHDPSPPAKLPSVAFRIKNGAQGNGRQERLSEIQALDAKKLAVTDYLMGAPDSYSRQSRPTRLLLTNAAAAIPSAPGATLSLAKEPAPSSYGGVSLGDNTRFGRGRSSDEASQDRSNLGLFLAQQDMAANPTGASGIGGAGGVSDFGTVVDGTSAPLLGELPVLGRLFRGEGKEVAEFHDLASSLSTIQPSTGTATELDRLDRFYKAQAGEPIDNLGAIIAGNRLDVPSSGGFAMSLFDRESAAKDELSLQESEAIIELRSESIAGRSAQLPQSRRSRGGAEAATPPPPVQADPVAVPMDPVAVPQIEAADRKSGISGVVSGPSLAMLAIPTPRQLESKVIEEQLRDKSDAELDAGQIQQLQNGIALSLGLEAARPEAPPAAAAYQGRERLARSQRLVERPQPTAAPLPEVETRVNRFSTISLNVSDVSFKLAAASLEQGQLPDPGSVRSEEFVNAFKYQDSAPRPGERVSLGWERARHPQAHDRELMRLTVQTASWGREQGRPLNLVILLDNSGSMERADRVLILRQALDVLARQLTPRDRISVVAFARTPRLWVDGLAGGNPEELLAQVGRLNPEGGTNLELALQLGYETASKHFLREGVNRVILMTDGAANLGNVQAATLRQRVENERKRNIALDCFGVGWEGFNDQLLEELSRNGDGRYGFLNSPAEAATEFAGQLAGALQVAAADVKVQIEFDPERVTTYRQIGYEKHQLTKEQFRDNTVDAAEIGAAESGTALYAIQVNAKGRGPLGVARVRFKVPETGQFEEREWLLSYSGSVPALDTAPPSMKLAAVAGLFAEWLGQNPYAAGVNLPDLQRYMEAVTQAYPRDERVRQLATMIQQARAGGGR